MAINDAGGKRGLARLQWTRAAYVNAGGRSAIRRFARPNAASARHRQRLLREAPTATAAVTEGTQAAAKHTHAVLGDQSLRVQLTLHNIGAQASLLGEGQDLGGLLLGSSASLVFLAVVFSLFLSLSLF